MKLINAKIVPGTVQEVVDDYGTIKGSAYGLFSAEESTENLPPIYPFFTVTHGTFSRPTVGELIWVISTTDNPTELFYFKQRELTEDIKNIIEEVGSNQCEIISNYEGKNGWAQIFFADGTGWMVRNDGVQFNMTDEKIVLTTGSKNRTISISSDGISLGTEGTSKEKAVLGDSLSKLLQQLDINIKTLASTASASPYTTHLTNVINKMASDLDSSLQNILSENVSLD